MKSKQPFRLLPFRRFAFFPASFIPHPSPLRHPSSLVVAWLFVFAFCAPHSIAATQIAWGGALVGWMVRLVWRPRARTFRTPIDYALLGFFILTFISALLSYDPDVSIGKLRAASLFTIVYVVAENVSSWQTVRRLALVLVASTMISVVYTFGVYAMGRGIKIEGLRPESPLYAAGIRDGDTLLETDGVRLSAREGARRLADELRLTPDEQLKGRMVDGMKVRVRTYRLESYPTFEVERGKLLEGDAIETRLGVRRFAAGRDERASGFYGHYVTYAEVLQLTASLAFGLFFARRDKISWSGLLLALSVVGLAGALLLTVTRAPWLGFLVSMFVVVAAGARRRRRMLLATALVAVPLVVGGLFVLQQKRRVGFLDRSDGSTAWRLMVYGEGLRLLVREPRHLLVGVGMDSIKRHYREWGLFDNGRQNIGHLHSTPLQIAVERGLPALFAWLALIFIYARMLWRLARRFDERRYARPHDDDEDQAWIPHGTVLGALGGLVGFLTSGLVHWNLGDSEVAMVFYFIMGLALVIERLSRENVSEQTHARVAA
ncbi:MAG TPA: O-antigen ligase family protein [Pyrinomonadaceae bacterium]